jgi:excinuclease ABC subunit C
MSAASNNYKKQDIQEKLSHVPEKPGVYLLVDKSRKTLYIGKAKELRTRLRSYFQKSSALDFRKTAMMKSVFDFEFTVTENELEALVLEANLIKQYRPRYNILLRDDKSYPYLKLTINERWPRLEVARRIQKDGAKYYGPYVPAGALKNTLSFIRNNFQVRTCKYSLEKWMRPCIQHQIKRCMGPCAGLIDHDEYVGMIHEIQLLLEGKNKGLLASLEKKMHGFSEEMKYEAAAGVRDRIKAIQRISESQKAVAPHLGDQDVIGFFRNTNTIVFRIIFSRNGMMIGSKDFFMKGTSGETEEYLMKNFIEQFYEKQIIPPPQVLCPCIPEDEGILSTWLSNKRGSKVKISVPRRGIRRKLIQMAEENAQFLAESRMDYGKKAILQEITRVLKLHAQPEDIGAFDVSNITGKEASGAFIYWKEDEFIKENYRHIRIDAIQGPDDYSMMIELVIRTLRKAEGINEGDDRCKSIKIPDLIIIDGGKGHLDAARKALKELGIRADIIGIAKDPDRAFLPGEKIPVSLEDGKASSLLLKKIRDEAHRFALTYHKKLRTKKIFESPLEKITGIGKKRRFELLRHFGSIEAIKNSSIDEISILKGFNRKIAEKVLNTLKSDFIKNNY